MCIVSLNDINVTLKKMNLAAEQHIMYLMIAHTEKYNTFLRTLWFKYPKKKKKIILKGKLKNINKKYIIRIPKCCFTCDLITHFIN